MFVECSTQYTSFSSRKRPANAGTERKQFTENASEALQQPILTHAHTKCPPVPYKLLSNNQEVLVYQNPVSNLSDQWVERNDNVPTSATGIYNGTENIFTKCQGSTAKRLKKRDI